VAVHPSRENVGGGTQEVIRFAVAVAAVRIGAMAQRTRHSRSGHRTVNVGDTQVTTAIAWGSRTAGVGIAAVAAGVDIAAAGVGIAAAGVGSSRTVVRAAGSSFVRMESRPAQRSGNVRARVFQLVREGDYSAIEQRGAGG